MKDLFLKTDDGLIPIDGKMVERYGLCAGRISPFSGFTIVDKDGNPVNAKSLNRASGPGIDAMPKGEGLEDDEIDEFPDTGAIMSQSEIIDFSHGTDSEQ